MSETARIPRLVTLVRLVSQAGHTYRCRRHPSPGKFRERVLVALPLRVHATAGPGNISGPSTAAAPGDAQICATEDVQNEVKAKRWMEGGGAPTLPSHPADRASVALAAAVGGDTSGRTRSLAISQRGHGHHLLQQNLKEVRQLRARAQDLAGEASCMAGS